MSATSRSKKIVVMDGAMGTLLLAQGFSIHDCLEELNLTHPATIETIHKSYLEVGAEVIITNTFGANRPERFYRLGVQIAKEAAGSKAKVFASIGPGSTNFSRQVRALEKEKPDGYLVETMISLGEAEDAAKAVREISRRSLIVSFAPHAKISSTKKLRQLGVDLIGVNCGGAGGPQEVFTSLQALALIERGPFCARPAAGLPGSCLSPEEFAEWAIKLKKLGCEWIGGCCGTTPEHIREIRKTL